MPHFDTVCRMESGAKVRGFKARTAADGNQVFADRSASGRCVFRVCAASLDRRASGQDLMDGTEIRPARSDPLSVMGVDVAHVGFASSRSMTCSRVAPSISPQALFTFST